MFETTGLLDKKFIKFIKKYSLTSYKRILFQVGLILFALNACICIYIRDYVFFAVNLFMVVFLWGYRHYLIRKNIDIYLELMNNDDASVKITTRFLNDGIHVSSKDKEGVFKYDSVSSYLKKNDMYILYTKGSKTIFIFCDCLTQEVEEKLIRFLKRQKTKIKWK